MLSEKVSGAGDDRHPQRGSQEIEQNECSPRHAQHTCERPRKNAEPENKARKKYRSRSVAGENLFTALYCHRRNPEGASIAIQQRPSAIVAHRISEIVAERGGASANENDPPQIELVLRIGQKAR